MKMGNHTLKHKVLTAAIATALGVAIIPQESSALTREFNWTGWFTMLDSNGNPLDNTSIARGNKAQTAISGTLCYDDTGGDGCDNLCAAGQTNTNHGCLSIQPFDFFANPPSQPATATGTFFDAIGDGSGGAGNLLLGNMLFDWNGTYGIPVSIVWDATGLLNAIAGGLVPGDIVTGVGVAPNSDGTYSSSGYLNLGPVPVATTSWNVTNTPACGLAGNSTTTAGGGCLQVSPSGMLPLVADTKLNANKSYSGPNVYGVSGIPMWDGPFAGFNANFDVVSMTLTNIVGAGPAFTEPADFTATPKPVIASTPTTFAVNLGTVTDELGTTTIEYSTDGKALNDGTKTWVTDDGANNPFNVPITQTVNTVTVDWRATDPGFSSDSFATQTVTVTVDDQVAPTFTGFPVDVNVNVNTTSDTVTFETAGTVAATDNIELSKIEWSLDGLNWTLDNPAANESSNAFGPGANTVFWRATDASGNSVTQQQTVTLNLPTGIVGQACTPDPDLLNAAIGKRQLQGSFTMRDPNGGLVGTVDAFVGGNPKDSNYLDPNSNSFFSSIDTSKVCADESCTVSGATLASPTPFFGELWTTNTIRLFNTPGTYTFNTIQDGNPPLSMTVKPGQVGAHMLFDWSVNKDIDVVVVWDYGCGDAQLVTTDPDGDGIIGTKMVDGPFKGFNAAFDLKTVAGQQPITTGGFTVNIPVVNNPVPNTSPLALSPGSIGTQLGGVQVSAGDLFNTFGASTDGSVQTSCAGG